MLEEKGMFQKLKENQCGREREWPEDTGEAERDHTVQVLANQFKDLFTMGNVTVLELRKSNLKSNMHAYKTDFLKT